MDRIKKFIVPFLLLSLIIANSSSAQDSDQNSFERHSTHDIVDARYGDQTMQSLIAKARALPVNLNKIIVGQELAIQVLSDRIVQYLEGFPERTREPISLNLVGLPGIGKSAMIDEVRKMGFEVVQLDVQSFVDKPDEFANSIIEKVSSAVRSKNPLILAIEEIDKVPELDQDKREAASKIIGGLNQILAEGKIQSTSSNTSLSNVMVITTMNFSSADIEAFSKEILKQEKSFYDFTVEDFQAFDSWVRKQPSARYKVLSKLFRSNTVSRLAPQTLILKPFTSEGYLKLTEIYTSRAIEINLNKMKQKMAKITYDQSLIEFLAKETPFAPSGARETVSRVNSMIEQLISYSMKVDGGNPASLSRPRTVHLSFDSNRGEAVMEITPHTYSRGKSVAGKSFHSTASLNEDTGLFDAPRDLVTEKPDLPTRKTPFKNTITKKQIFQTRFPEGNQIVKNLGPEINKSLIGQESAVATIQDDFSRYMARDGAARKEPSSRTVIGFPGIGKSELFNLTASGLNIPIVRVNMQQFSSDAPETVSHFLTSLEYEIDKARFLSRTGKYILLIEELDKVFEVNPQTGALANRPIMSIIKDILNDGQAKAPNKDSIASRNIKLDVRDAFVAMTMNFSVDRFGFKADPRLTSINDVIEVWKRLKATPTDLKSILGTMFLPETVSRLISRILIMKPLEKADYEELISKQLEKVKKARLIDSDGRNLSQIEVALTDRYKEFLFSETVIPSEGARNVVVASQNIIGLDLEYAISKIRKSAKYAKIPITIVLDYEPNRQLVISKVVPTGAQDAKKVPLAERPVALQFPPLAMTGKIPENRLHTSAHEFGHAYIAILLGLRFEYISVVSPEAGTGGYVKFTSTNGQSAYALMAQIYSTLASRSLERIVMSENPKSSQAVFDITSGPSSDIEQATRFLFQLIYQLGMDPHNGTIDRMGGRSSYANFSDLPKAEVDRLGRILREMEDHIVSDILGKHSKKWLAEKISKLASAGGMTEKEFYELVNKKLPEGPGLAVPNSILRDFFKNTISDGKSSPSGEVLANSQLYKNFFLNSLRKIAAEKRPRSGQPIQCSKLYSSMR